MADETIFPTLPLLLQIANLCRDLLAQRRRRKDTRKLEQELVTLIEDLFHELKFCQDVGDSVRNFQSYFGLAVIRLREVAESDHLDREVGSVNKWFKREVDNEIAAVIEDKRGRMSPDPIPDVRNRQLRTELVRAAANYHHMIEAIHRLTLNFPHKLQEMSRDKDQRLPAFSAESIRWLEDIRDYQVATIRSLIRTGAVVTGLIA